MYGFTIKCESTINSLLEGVNQPENFITWKPYKTNILNGIFTNYGSSYMVVKGLCDILKPYNTIVNNLCNDV